MTDEEYKQYCLDNTATVADLIEHLQKNFKPTDRLCFWDEGGAWMSCQHIPNDWFKKGRMFFYVKDDKARRMKQYGDSKKKVDEDFEFVQDDDIVVY